MPDDFHRDAELRHGVQHLHFFFQLLITLIDGLKGVAQPDMLRQLLQAVDDGIVFLLENSLQFRKISVEFA